MSSGEQASGLPALLYDLGGVAAMSTGPASESAFSGRGGVNDLGATPMSAGSAPEPAPSAHIPLNFLLDLRLDRPGPTFIEAGHTGRIRRGRHQTSGGPGPWFMSDGAVRIRPAGYGPGAFRGRGATRAGPQR